MKIFIVTFAKFDTSVGKAITSFCKECHKNVFVHIIVFVRGGKTSTKEEALQWQKITKENLQVDVLQEKGIVDIQAIRLLCQKINFFKPNIIETSGYKSNIIICILNIFFKKKWVAFFHGWTSENRQVLIYNWLDKIALRFAHKIYVVAENTRKNFLKMGFSHEKIQTIYNAVEPPPKITPQKIKLLRENLNLPENSFIISVIGRLSNEKGHVYFLRALQYLLNSKNNILPNRHVTALIVGDGPEINNLRKLTHNLGLNRHVIFCGFKKKIQPFYHISDLVCIPSLSENFPYVILEAFLAQKPVLATKVGGIPEIVIDGVNGLLVPPKSPKELAYAIDRCMKDSDKLRSLVNNITPRDIQNAYSTKKRAQSILKSYSNLLKQ